MTEFTSEVANAAIKRELNCYKIQWHQLQLAEIHNPYGPSNPEAGDIKDLKRSGNCIQNVTLRRQINCMKATWVGDDGDKIIKGISIVISRTHPLIDQLRTAVVTSKGKNQLEFRVGRQDEDKVINDGTWRLDVAVNYAQYYRVEQAVDSFTQVLPTSSPSALQVLVGSSFGNSEQRRAINQHNVQVPDLNAQLVGLNDAQKNAVVRSLRQRVLPLQGPPGTGKTQVAEAIFKVWNSTGVKSPMLGATASNVAADNLAHRMLMGTRLNVKRYGPAEKITHHILRSISSQEIAIKANNGPWGKNPITKRKRKGIEREIITNTDVMIGTL